MAEIDAALAAMEPPPIVPSAQALDEGQRVKQTTCIFEMRIKGMTFRAKARGGEVRSLLNDAEVNKLRPENEPRSAMPDDAAEYVSITKALIKCPELNAVKQVKRDFVHWLSFRALPCSLLGNGMRLIPLVGVPAVHERFLQFKRDRVAAVRSLLGVYVQQQQESKRRLEPLGLYRQADFPSLVEVARAFTIEQHWWAFDAPRAMEDFDAALFEESARQIGVEMAEAAGEIRDAFRAQMQEYVNWLAERLTASGDGKRKAIAETKLEDITTFLNQFSQVNILQDAELAPLVEQARQTLAGIDLKTLRKDDNARQTVADAFAKIKAQTDKWVVTQHRSIMEDDDAI